MLGDVGVGIRAAAGMGAVRAHQEACCHGHRRRHRCLEDHLLLSSIIKRQEEIAWLSSPTPSALVLFSRQLIREAASLYV